MKKRNIRAITAFKVIQGHRGRYQRIRGSTTKRDRKSAISLQRGQFNP